MVGLNFARYRNDIPTSTFTIALGIIALFSGTGDLFGFNVPVFPLLLILIGAHIIFRGSSRRPLERKGS